MKNTIETANVPIISVDRELQKILMQVHACRNQLLSYTESIRDRELYDLVKDSADGAADDLANAITDMSQLMANQISFHLIETSSKA